VGDFVVDALRTTGGFAHLYVAHDVHTGGAVALKVLRRALAYQGSAVARFHREVQALRELSHPAIVRVLAHGDIQDGRPWLSMEWIEGGDLAAHVRARGSLPLAACLALLAPLVDALEHAHAIGLVHRDLKAENVMLRDGAPILVDFGIAHWRAREASGEGATSHSLVGSPCSMAPEQILGGAVDARTDVYALGVLLFRLATGALPFRSQDPIELEEMHLHGEPPRASALAPVPAALDALVRRCMAKDPADRPARAADVTDALRAIVEGRAPGPRAAIYVEVLFDGAADPTDAALDDAGAVLDIARRVLEAAGLAVSNVHAGALLALGPDASGAADLSGRLARALDTREASADVGVAITARLGASEEELRRIGGWARRERGVWTIGPERADR
jgi:serine/threonine-protein kinase